MHDGTSVGFCRTFFTAKTSFPPRLGVELASVTHPTCTKTRTSEKVSSFHMHESILLSIARAVRVAHAWNSKASSQTHTGGGFKLEEKHLINIRHGVVVLHSSRPIRSVLPVIRNLKLTTDTIYDDVFSN